MKLTIALLATIVSVSAFVSGMKYGRPADLRGAKTFYVDAESDANARNDLVDRIEKKTVLKVVDDMDKADVVVIWTSRGKKCGEAAVARVLDGEPRLVWNWKDCGTSYTSREFLFVRKFANLLEDNQ
jgi:hypothetical protein